MKLENLRAEKKKIRNYKLSLKDSTEAILLDALALEHCGNDPKAAKDYATQCLELSRQIGYKIGIGHGYYGLGLVNQYNGDYLQAIKLLEKSLSYYKEMNSEKNIGYCYNAIGICYENIGNYPLALNNYFTSLKIVEKTGNKGAIAVAFNNIGNINTTLKNTQEALKYHFASLRIREELGDKRGIADSKSNIADIYSDQHLYTQALKFHFECLNIREAIGDKSGMATSYLNLGLGYLIQHNFVEALKNMFAALKIQEELGDKGGMATSYSLIGGCNTKLKKHLEAEESLKNGLILAKEIRNVEILSGIYKNLSELDSARGNLSQSLAHYKLHITYRDSLLNNENIEKTVSMQMNYDFDKKEAATKAAQEKKDAIALKELQRQKLVRNSFMGGFAVVLLFAGVFFTQRNKIKKGKKLSDELLLNILPSEVADELKQTGQAEAKLIDQVTVLFTDFKGFTALSEKLTPKELVKDLHECFTAFDNIMAKHGLEKIKTIGDAYMAAGGLPTPNKTHAIDVVGAAIEIREFMEDAKTRKIAKHLPYFEIRIGVHTGPVVAGIVGVKKFSYDIWGDTVNTASRMESSGEVGKVNISETTYALVKDKFNCHYRGEIEAKGKGKVKMYFVEDTPTVA